MRQIEAAPQANGLMPGWRKRGAEDRKIATDTVLAAEATLGALGTWFGYILRGSGMR